MFERLGRVQVTADSDASVGRLWAVATDWAGHGRFFPLTTVAAQDAPDGVGRELDAVTALGPVRLADPMVLTEWQPPGERGRFAIRKVGSVLGGTATVEVTPTATGARISWTTDVGPAPRALRRLIGPINAVAARPLYQRVVRGMAREAERG